MTTDDDTGEQGPILVVDEDEHLRDALAKILEHEGHRVLQAADASTALRMTMEHDPDLLVLDHTLASPEGESVLGELRRELAHETPPALLLTAPLRHLERAKRVRGGAGLEKPFNVPELIAAVDRHRRRVTRERS